MYRTRCPFTTLPKFKHSNLHADMIYNTQSPRKTLPPKVTTFPWRNGNRFHLLEDGPRYMPRILSFLETAQREILIEMYLMESGELCGHLINTLASAVERGVEVKLLIDDFGSQKLKPEDRERIVKSGIVMQVYNPLMLSKGLNNLSRDHRKLIVIDNVYAFIGGLGFCDEFFSPAQFHADWYDLVLQIEGPVVHDWQQLFLSTWQNQKHAVFAIANPIPAQHPPKGSALAHIALTYGLRKQEIKRNLVNRIAQARNHIWLATAYFLPSMKIRRALSKAAKRGVDVRLLLPGPYCDHPPIRHAGRRFYSQLLKKGVKIYEYQPRFMHAKLAICDDWVSIGSSNFDRWNSTWNLDANQEIFDLNIKEQLLKLLRRNFALSEEITPSLWMGRPWHHRTRERLWGYIDVWLYHYAHRVTFKKSNKEK